LFKIKALSLCKVGFSLVLVFVLLAVFTACSGQKEEEQTQTAVAIYTMGPTQNIADVISVSGNLLAKEEVNIIPQASGEVKEILVNVGDAVKAGDALAKIDDKQIRLQLAQAQAAYKMAKANQTDAKTNLARMEELYKEGAISLAQLEQARSAVTMSDPASAAASVAALQLQLQNTTITSPIDGVISAANLVKGGIALPTSLAFTVVNMDQMRVDINVSESKINKLSLNQKAQVLVDSASAEPFVGTITSIAPAANALSKFFPVGITIENPDHILKSGMFAQVDITTALYENVLVMPRIALAASGTANVFVVKDGLATKVEVQTGAMDDTWVEITSGLKAGDQVVTKGQQKVHEGTEVLVTEEYSQ